MKKLLILFALMSLISCSKEQFKPIITECVITIDDAPRFPVNTAKMLDVLKGYPATFFCIGIDLVEQPELANRIAKDFTLANHTYDHQDMKLKGNLLNNEVYTTQEIVDSYNTLYNKNNKFFRFPYGSCTDSQQEYLKSKGYYVSWWNMDASDWDNNVSLESIKNYYLKVLNEATTTPIILFHLSDNSIEGMKWLLGELDRRNIKAIGLEEYLNK